jgi:uncharacterized protein with von Willebrand factor type A (vWA) domain
MTLPPQRRLSTQQGLVENLADFCRLLRWEGLRVGLSSLLEALEGLRWVSPIELESFRVLLGATLVHSREEMERFQELFQEFWLGIAPDAGSGPRGQGGGDARQGEPLAPEAPRTEGQGPGDQAEVSMRGIMYSPHPLQRPGPGLMSPVSLTNDGNEAMRRFLRPLATRPSRRLEPSALGSRFSFRRTMRRSLQYGGDLLYLELLAPRIRRPRIVLLCDVSGSMDEHARLILEFSHTLSKVDRRAEVFLFSTEIARLTPLMRAKNLERTLLELPRVMPQWGAGTRIGHCLRCLRERFGSKVLPGRPVLVIYSDGWDQGEIELLRREMQFLRRSCRAILWLNPLVGTPGYEPTCKGMATALPFVDLFLPMGGMEDLKRLAKEAQRIMA